MAPRLAFSVPGGGLLRAFPGSVVPAAELGRALAAGPLPARVAGLMRLFEHLRFETVLVPRPEMFGPPGPGPRLAGPGPRLAGHVFVGPPEGLKYLKGTPTYLLPVAAPEPHGEAPGHDQARLSALAGVLNGYWLPPALQPPVGPADVLVPGPAMWSAGARAAALAGAGHPGGRTPLFLNPDDPLNAAHVMASRREAVDGAWLEALRRSRGPVLLAVLDPEGSAGRLAGTVRDLAHLRALGIEATLLVVLGGEARLDLAALTRLASRLCPLVGGGPGGAALEGDEMVVLDRGATLGTLLAIADVLLLPDEDWSASEVVLLALGAGLTPWATGRGLVWAAGHPDYGVALGEAGLGPVLRRAERLDASVRARNAGRFAGFVHDGLSRLVARLKGG